MFNSRKQFARELAELISQRVKTGYVDLKKPIRSEANSKLIRGDDQESSDDELKGRSIAQEIDY